MPAFLSALLRSRKFWLGVFGTIQAIVFSAIPDFPDEVWQSITALVMVLIAMIAVEDAASKINGNGPKA